MVNVYIKERINDQTTIWAGGVTGNATYLGQKGGHGPRRSMRGPWKLGVRVLVLSCTRYS